MSESYEELKPGDYISRCNNMLANKMQCIKPGSFKVLDGDGKETGFQLCKRCKVLQEAGFGHSPIMPINETGTVEAQPGTLKETEEVKNDSAKPVEPETPTEPTPANSKVVPATK